MSSLPPDPRHLVVRAPNWVGDLVMATPVLVAALADERFERVTVVVREHLVDVLAGIVPVERIATVGGERREVDVLRELRADAVLLLTNSFGSALRAWRARIPLRAGAALGGRRPLLTHAVVPPTRGGRRVPVPTAHLHRDVAGLLGIAVPSLRPRLAFGAVDAARSAAALAELGVEAGEPYFLCAPGAAYGAAKLWPPASFARAIERLRDERGWTPVVVCGPGEEALAQEVAGRSGAYFLPPAARGLTLLKPLVAGAQLLLVGDSGPRWYAAAFDVPCVSILGPNFPELTATSLEWCEVVRRDDLECAPCLERVCPLGHHRCLTELDVEPVLDAAERVLTRRLVGS